MEIREVVNPNAVEKYVLDRFKKELTDAEIEKLNKIIEKGCFSRMYADIANKARKVAVNNCAAVSEEEVFGWARHWLDETDPEKLNEPSKTEVKEHKEKPSKPAKEKKTAPTTGDEGEQLTLFNLLEV